MDTSRDRRTFGALTAVMLLVLGACSPTGGDGVASAGGKASTTAEDTEKESLDEEAQALAFAECMRDNGVDMPDPEPGQEGLSGAFHGAQAEHDRETVEQALAACEDLLPERAHGADHGRDEETMLELADCLREQGIDVPDNVFEGGALHGEDEDEVRAAMEVCRDEVAGGER